MPAFFRWSINARKDTPQNKKKKYCEPNNSTMNRICKAFDDIGNINLNYAGVPQFNWQMLLSGPCTTSRLEIPELFCQLDNVNLSSVIKAQDSNYANERQLINGTTLVAEDIIDKMIEQFGSLEEAYPYVAKYLFAGEGATKSAHKQMFWKVFGNIALNNIKMNLVDCDVCPECGIKVPSWVKDHQCVKNTKGFYACIDCGILCERTNAKQCRCEDCQKNYKMSSRRNRQRAKRELAKAIIEARTTRLQSYSTET